jgi:hypothetical protein
MCLIIYQLQVSKLHYALSHEAVIWKRLLFQTEAMLPPLPPTVRYSLNGLNGLEAERLLVRALSVDQNWRAPVPRTFRARSVEAWADVHHMCAVPGGQYFFTSECARGGGHWRIMLYYLDHCTGAAQPVGRLPTGEKAFNLQAKYMTVDGVAGIVLSYEVRCLKYKSPNPEFE